MSIKELYSIFKEYPTICTDSRNIVPDSIFFALKGDNFDANNYVKTVLEQGCAYAVSDNADNANIEGCIIVDNVLETLQQLARHHREETEVHIIAITGTNGKTTTKELLTAVLAQNNVIATKGNLNNHIGVPLTLLSINKNTRVAIVEMGANHPGEIAALCNIALPNSGIITNIGKAHLEGFGSEEGVKKTKGELYDYLEKNRGQIFYNADDSVLSQMANKTKGTQLVEYGKTLANVKINNDIFLGFCCTNPELNIKTNLVGEYNINNVLATVAVGLNFEVSAKSIETALQNYKPDNNRSQFIKTTRNNVIMDAYNANPSSMNVAISNFANINANKKVLILGDMLELGKDSFDEHTRIVELLKKHNFDKTILVGECFNQFKDNSSVLCFANTTLAEEYLKANVIEQSTILVKGSRGIKLEKLLDYL